MRSKRMADGTADAGGSRWIDYKMAGIWDADGINKAAGREVDQYAWAGKRVEERFRSGKEP